MRGIIGLIGKFVLCGACIIGATNNVAAQGQGDLFTGKKITLLIGAGVGGGADTYARLFGRHVGNFLPGKPSVVPKNMQGAGGMIVANQIFNIAPRDGTEIGTFATSGALQPLFHNPKAKFNTVKFTWIGNMDSEATVCGAWKRTGIKTWKDLKGRMTRFGAGGAVSATAVHPKVVGALLGIKVKVILGYRGTKAVNLAMQRGEVDGVCGLFVSTIRTAFLHEVQSGDMKIWMTFGKQRASMFPNVPTIYEVVKNDNDRMLAELLFGQAEIGRPLAGPPGLSTQVATALRRGFDAAMKDKALLAEAKRLHLEIKPMSGEETEQKFKKFFAFPAPVVNRLKSFMTPKKKR